MKRNILIFIILLTITSSCEKIELKTADNDIPVVESYITPGNDILVSIFKQLVFDSDDTTIQPIDNLAIRVSDGESWFGLTNTGDGIYKSSEIEILAEMDYYLEFEYNNLLVTSETFIPTKPVGFETSSTTIEAFTFSFEGGGFPTEMPEMPESTTLSWLNANNDYHMIVVENTENDPQIINEPSDDFDRPQRSFRSTPIQGSSQDLSPMSFSYYGAHRVILYKLNPEYAALYEQIGSSSLDIVAPPTNIINGLGIFTGINSDTLYVNVVEQ